MIRKLRGGTLVLVAAATASCSADVTHESVGAASGRLVLAFSKSPAVAMPGAALAETSTAGNVSIDQIESIHVSVTAVEALYQEPDADEAEWVTRTLAQPVMLDLLALPVGPENAVRVLVEALGAGTYLNLRLHVSTATITLSEAVRIGGGPVARTWTAGVAHPIRIAGDEGGQRLMIPTASFEVLDDAATEIDIIFDEGTSVRSVVATPHFILMAPVLIAETDRADD